jgi:hypothetical protein
LVGEPGVVVVVVVVSSLADEGCGAMRVMRFDGEHTTAWLMLLVESGGDDIGSPFDATTTSDCTEQTKKVKTHKHKQNRNVPPTSLLARSLCERR